VPDATIRRTWAPVRDATSLAYATDTLCVSGAAGDAGVFAIDRTDHRHRIVDGDRDTRDRLVETEHTDGCGWDVDFRGVFDARVYCGGLYVASRFLTRLYRIGE
jgi:hypothetical protein